MSDRLLELAEVSKHFGGLRAVDGVSFGVQQGEILGLLGPNGAGKTVCFNLISGVYRPTAGDIRLAGRRTNGLPPQRLAALGIGRTFQIVKPFAHLTVLENVLAGRGVIRYAQPDARVVRLQDPRRDTRRDGAPRASRTRAAGRSPGGGAPPGPPAPP